MVLWIGFDLHAKIEAGDGNNWTALHLAALNGKETVAAQLLQANASPTAVDKDGHTPAQNAKQCRHGDLAARLLEAEQAAALK